MKHISYIEKHRRSGFMYILGIFIVAGIISGAFFQAKYSPAASALLHQYSAPVYGSTSLSGYFLGSFIVTALLIISAFLSGFSALGQPVAPLILGYKGFGIGATAAMLYSSLSVKAVVSIAILVVPKALLTSFVLLLGSRELIRASVFTFSCWSRDKGAEKREQDLRIYCVKFLVLILIALIISALDAAVNLLFTRLS